MSRLEVCPWCHKTPRQRLAKNEPVEKWWQIYCDNSKCPIQPYTDFYKHKGSATRAWNSGLQKRR